MCCQTVKRRVQPARREARELSVPFGGDLRRADEVRRIVGVGLSIPHGLSGKKRGISRPMRGVLFLLCLEALKTVILACGGLDFDVVILLQSSSLLTALDKRS